MNSDKDGGLGGYADWIANWFRCNKKRALEIGRKLLEADKAAKAGKIRVANGRDVYIALSIILADRGVSVSERTLREYADFAQIYGEVGGEELPKLVKQHYLVAKKLEPSERVPALKKANAECWTAEEFAEKHVNRRGQTESSYWRDEILDACGEATTDIETVWKRAVDEPGRSLDAETIMAWDNLAIYIYGLAHPPEGGK